MHHAIVRGAMPLKQHSWVDFPMCALWTRVTEGFPRQFIGRALDEAATEAVQLVNALDAERPAKDPF
jgi:hypothetical protein